MKKLQQGFTLIELLIVVAIIGVLAAIAIPNLINALQRARQKRTMADMRSMATAWEARSTDQSSYMAAGATFTMPANLVTWAVLSGRLAPTYIKVLPKNDAWGDAYTFSADVSNYGLRSAGRDNTYSGSTYTVGPTTDFASDIVYSNGLFVCYPEGVQAQ